MEEVRDVGFQTDIADAATDPAARYRTVDDVHGQLSEAPQPARNAGTVRCEALLGAADMR